MQELQCADCIMNFLETEKEAQVREYVFDLLFEDIHQVSKKHILQLLLSYSLSMEARQTLDCISKWLIINIGNEIIQNIFDQIITDHFLLLNRDATDASPPNLVNLAVISPLFSSLFMTICLDMLSSGLVTNHDKCLGKLFALFSAWLEKNPMIPVIAFKANLSHTMHNIFNPLPGLLYTTVIYQFKECLECFENNSVLRSEKQVQACVRRFQRLDEEIDRVQLLTLKLFKDIANIIQSTKLFGPDVFKLLSVKHLENIGRRFEDLSGRFEALAEGGKNKGNGCQGVESLRTVREECLERLAQILEACWQYDFATCTKSECKGVLKAACFNLRQDTADFDEDMSLLSMVLYC